MSEARYPVPDQHDDARFRWLFGYWLERHRGALLPGRAAIDPLDFPSLLGSVNLVDVEPSSKGCRYRFRLWGSKVAHIFGVDHSGKYLEEIALVGTLEGLRERFDACVRDRRPSFIFRDLSLERNEMVRTRRLLLPLASDGKAVDMLLGLILLNDDRQD